MFPPLIMNAQETNLPPTTNTPHYSTPSNTIPVVCPLVLVTRKPGVVDCTDAPIPVVCPLVPVIGKPAVVG
ncbi:unnamed protein product [Rotaria magnacalcarata]|uniref:Uncharacterized protein n=1 Tax=Rotaria magnacalcarata TaxID=392030 RepID=A0A8S2S1S1_9BILA|nr:unnamed protein product [Rotaria magnacalcarata]